MTRLCRIVFVSKDHNRALVQACPVTYRKCCCLRCTRHSKYPDIPPTASPISTSVCFPSSVHLR